MSEHKFIAGVLVFTFFMIFILGEIAIFNTAINCPTSSEINIDQNGSLGLTSLLNSIGLVFSPCSGISPWIILIIFVPLALVVIGYLTPFVG